MAFSISLLMLRSHNATSHHFLYLSIHTRRRRKADETFACTRIKENFLIVISKNIYIYYRHKLVWLAFAIKQLTKKEFFFFWFLSNKNRAQILIKTAASLLYVQKTSSYFFLTKKKKTKRETFFLRLRDLMLIIMKC